MIFTLLFALVGDLDFTLEYNVTKNTSDLFLFDGKNRSAHLFISNSILNLICQNETNIVHKELNISYGMLSYTWPDIVNGIRIDTTFNETAAVCNGPYQSYTFINPATILEPEPCLTYTLEDQDNFTVYLTGPLIIQLLVIIYLVGIKYFPRWRGNIDFRAARHLPVICIDSRSENMDSYSSTSVRLTELDGDKV